MTWTEADIPDQTGRVAVITGANSGIGFEAARALAEKGAHVVLACRSQERGGAALEQLKERVPDGSAELELLDLADLASIRDFAERLDHERIDLLVNNAGLMAIPHRTTKDGFEMQFGVNHLGHFALTGLLLDRLAEDARVVSISSNGHKGGWMKWDDLMREHSVYERWTVYCQSKLANLLFSYELQRRFEAHGMKRKAVTAHPGYAQTHLFDHGPSWAGPIVTASSALVAHDAKGGAGPTLMAATHPDVVGNDYIGPRGWFEFAGPPVKTRAMRKARNPEDARRLWEVSSEYTGVHYLEEGDATP